MISKGEVLCYKGLIWRITVEKEGNKKMWVFLWKDHTHPFVYLYASAAFNQLLSQNKI